VSGAAEYLRLAMPVGSRFVGSFHTHQDPARHTGIGLSGADFTDMANQGERISLVQSGQHIFMLLQTEETPTNLDMDESDLFQLVRQLTSEQPPLEVWGIGREAEPVIQIELPFSILLSAVDRLSVDKATLLRRRLEERLVKTS
jgi:hypothetical protein